MFLGMQDLILPKSNQICHNLNHFCPNLIKFATILITFVQISPKFAKFCPKNIIGDTVSSPAPTALVPLTYH